MHVRNKEVVDSSLTKLLQIAPKAAAVREWMLVRDALPIIDGLPGRPDSAARAVLQRADNGRIAVILTAYKRCHMLARQIASIKAADMSHAAWSRLGTAGYPMPSSSPRNYSVSSILLLRNGAHCDPSPSLLEHPDVHVIESLTWNTKFFGRYLPALMLEEQFTLVLDDDIVLQKDTLANLMRAMALHDEHAVIGTSGKRIRVAAWAPPTLPLDSDIDANGVDCSCHDLGDPRTYDSLVDYVTNSYLFPTVFARLLFGPGAWTQTLDNSDDMTMGMLARRYLGAPSVCPMQQWDACIADYGGDSVSTSGSSTHWLVRRSTLTFWYSRGYRGVCPRGPTDEDDFDTRCLPVATPATVDHSTMNDTSSLVAASQSVDPHSDSPSALAFADGRLWICAAGLPPGACWNAAIAALRDELSRNAGNLALFNVTLSSTLLLASTLPELVEATSVARQQLGIVSCEQKGHEPSGT